MEIGKVGVVGCGTMGSGICEVVARAGLPVTFVETSNENVEAAYGLIKRSLERQVARSKLDAAERDTILGRIVGDVRVEVLADADLVIEAVPELLDIKQETARRLDPVLKDDAIFATNTSSLAVMDVAVHTRRPDRVLGFHFFNPAPVMRLIELVTTVMTDPEVIETARTFALQIGKEPIVAADRAGFVANLLLFPYLNQAAGMYETGYASREDIDAAMRLGAGHPLGPLALLDLIGLDSATSIMERMYEQFHDARYAPRPSVRHLVTAGYKGRKNGRGFYTYAEPGSGKIDPTDEPALTEPDQSLIAGWTRIGVLGSGTMASGIAEVCAKAGFDVTLRARSIAKAEAATAKVAKSLGRAVEKGKLDAAARDIALSRIAVTEELSDFADCDLVVEAVAENLDLKRQLFGELDSHTKPEAVLATTTSSLPVIQCAMATSRPERVVGLHFFNPAAIMRLVEVVPTLRTSDQVVEQGRAVVARLSRHGVQCADRAGFIVNALLFPYLNDAVKMLADGYATAKNIDTAMKLGCGHPMGPFELMDAVGLDVTLEILKALQAEFRHPGYLPSPLLENMVAVGYLGRKVGRGFYVY
ncbi:MAG: 3-hydroxyacyl-CoA dehydrogenase family protein [Egibacteraceae bacterium]